VPEPAFLVPYRDDALLEDDGERRVIVNVSLVITCGMLSYSQFLPQVAKAK
jgi:hypothetical protein